MTPTHEINQYITEIDKIYRSGKGTEHSYRPALKSLFEAITSGLAITNEPKHIDCGAPDYIITRDEIPVGYIEAKDIPIGINNKANKEQFDRYKQSLNNLIITDYLTFQLFIDEAEIVTVTIAKENNGGISPDKKQFDAFMELIEQFSGFKGKSIYQSEQLARMMAAKAKLLAGIIEKVLHDTDAENGTLSGQLEGFRKILIHGLSIPAFADIYAQTLAYGMFAARFNDLSNNHFSRQIAANLIPQSNPFLRKFFQYIAGFDLDDRIRWIIDALADLFNCVAVEDILKEFGKANQDPYIHFYETFLAEYDPKLRESRGVYYTPVPVVKFIVQAVDDILQKEFNLPRGLADNSKIKRSIAQGDGTKKDIEFHKVQILDPATGTGTFLAEVIENIYKRFANQKGMWAGYCAEHLIPRLNGFEILMASYAMAHFKLDMILKETGYQGTANSRLRVYLTNSLEEPEDVVSKFPMVEWLTQEANEANSVKRDTPVMVVLGNPPYSVSSQNKGEWIQSLIADYKKDLNEKKLNLDDDYIKFIRFGQYFIEKNNNGVLAFISNNSFIDGITHRKMRECLLDSFDTIYILDLHGNSNKKEKSPDGSPDENVFDILQGVSINIFIKAGIRSDKAANVYHFDLFGKREYKYDFLYANSLSNVQWQRLLPQSPYFFFTSKVFDNDDKYNKGFSLTSLFDLYNNGVKTDRDALFVDMDSKVLESRIKILLSGSYDSAFIEKYNVKDSGSYKLTKIIKNKKLDASNIHTFIYRPFDNRYIYYQHGITSRSAYNVIKHILHSGNIGLIAARQCKDDFGILPINSITGHKSCVAYDINTIFPLYLYPDTDALDKEEKRRPNLNQTIVEKISETIQLDFTIENEDNNKNTFSPIDLFDYIYAVLYSNNYRTKYREFLKIDFPRVPYPENKEIFQELSQYGAILRSLHLLENVEPLMDIATYPVEGNNSIDKLVYINGRVSINKTQYFDNVPLEAWEYYIGGYQPAQKWLKDRKERILDYEDILHYQKIITVLKLTIEIQQHIDKIIQ